MKKTPEQRIGDFLKMWRKESGLTQWDIAEKCDISNQYISNMERGLHLPSPKALRAYIKHCGVDGEEIMELIIEARESKLRQVLKIKKSK